MERIRKGKTLALTLGLSLAVVTAQAEIIEAEYFFNSDPGIGNGTSIAIAGGVTDFTVPQEDIAALGAGTHRLVVRFRDDSPSEGLTSLVSVDASDPANVSYTLETDTVGESEWSVAFARTFTILPDSPPDPAGSIDYAEYVIVEDGVDTTPALGSGMEITDLGTLVDGQRELAFNVSANALNPGDIYRFSVRFRDSLGGWSTTETRRFMLASVPEVNGSTVTAGEYVLSSLDGSLLPAGLGSGVILPLPDAVEGQRIVTSTIPPETIEALNPGTYRITFRFRDDAGGWSVPETRTFALTNPADVLPSGSEVVVGEYFFLADAETLTMPPLGSGTPLTLPAAVGVDLQIDTVIPSSAFPAGASGIYHLGVRFMDDVGAWSQTFSRTTLLPEPEFTASLTTRLRYNLYDPDDALVEQDMMFGSDTVVNFPSDIVDIVETHQLPLDPDPYTLEIYLLDNDGQPSSEFQETFRMVAHRDYWDATYFTDPGERADLLVSGPNADPNGDGVSNLLAFVLGLDPMAFSSVLDFTSLDGEDHPVPFSQIPTEMPDGVTLKLWARGTLPLGDLVWTYDTSTDTMPLLINVDDFTLLSPVEASRSDRLNVQTPIGGAWIRHFFELSADLTGDWPFTYAD